MNKLFCIASSPAFKQGLLQPMGELGFTVLLNGELLGIDYSAGGPLNNPAVQLARKAQTKS